MTNKVSKREQKQIEHEVLDAIDRILSVHGFSDKVRKDCIREAGYGLFAPDLNPESSLSITCRS